MTDNRTNEPTEEQVEAAAKAVADAMFPRWNESERVQASRNQGSLIRKSGEAALVAARGAAPKAEGECDNHRPVQQVLLDLARGISGFPDDVLDEFVADAVSELRAADLLRTPGGPSDEPNQSETKSGQDTCSTEDEEAIAARICEKNYVSPDGKPYCQSCLEEVRAVVEAIGGEVR